MMFYGIVDLEDSALSGVISEEMPSGEDPRKDASPLSVYFTLKDVRNSARALERNALVENEPLLQFANRWDPIIEQVPVALTDQCKDLELAAWLIEALARRHGFKGLICGFNIVAILIENHWETLYPSPDEDGLETRVAPIVGLNGFDSEGTLLMPLSCIPLTEVYGEQAYSLWEFEQACEVERMDEDKRNQRYASGTVRLEDIRRAVSPSKTSFFVELLNDITSAFEAYQRMAEAIDIAVGEPQPSSHIAKKLTACIEAVRFLAGEKLSEVASLEDSAELDEVEPEDGSDSSKSNENAFSGQLTSREEAITQLRKIAQFFKQTEPHSPMAYAIEQVVRWSGMTLPDLLQELITDNEARAGYFRLTGITSELEE